MDQRQWVGFDPRKVCPHCGGYQTRVWKTDRPASSPRSFLWLFLGFFLLSFLAIGLMVLSAVKGGAAEPYRSLGLLLSICLVLGLVLVSRIAGPARGFSAWLAQRNQQPGPVENEPSLGLQPPVVYHLECRNCGWRWQKAAAEWENDRQYELDNLNRQPLAQPPTGLDQDEDLAKIEYQAPDPKRGAFLVISFIFLMFIVAGGGYGLLRYLSNPGSSLYPLALFLGVFIILWASIAILFKFQHRMLKVIPILLLAIFLLVLRLFIK